jgi:homoserine kinase
MNVKVRVPATTVNLGPGFDVFGAALSVYNDFKAKYAENAEKTSFTLEGNGKKLFPKERKILFGSLCKKLLSF